MPRDGCLPRLARRVLYIGEPTVYWLQLLMVVNPSHSDVVARAKTGDEFSSNITFNSADDRIPSRILDREPSPSAELGHPKDHQTGYATGKSMLLHGNSVTQTPRAQRQSARSELDGVGPFLFLQRPPAGPLDQYVRSPVAVALPPRWC
jgi:hypothetical protein